MILEYLEDNDYGSSYDDVDAAPNEARLPPDLIAAAACYIAAKNYEDHVAEHGRPESQEQAKEFVTGLSDAFIDHIIKKKSFDNTDAARAKDIASNDLGDALTASGEF
ncbi:hypothetical protein ABOM_006407 [Aspergillus bombycis]|uniref:Uncharacterized protein n=1 Tax=Aspergillus bombycis TaxID=109264 RepID=A0A1F8A0U0_9EURO|nr:hypothetical protein ABOM_006407 [Aspergillus bombycis]OGM45323.1 hypothetical protein ABOM_006407 [Aspergillus bombycis]